MVASLNTIPHDIFELHIASNMNMTDIVKMACVAKAYQDKDKYIMDILKKNKFIRDYAKEHIIDIVALVNTSSFCFQLFESFLEYIQMDNVEYLEYWPSINTKTSSQNIVSTIQVFQLLQSYAIEENCSNMTTRSISMYLMNYFKNVYITRTRCRDFNETILRNFILFSNEWHLVNINLYTIYENYNSLLSSKRSFSFKQYLENNENNIIDCRFIDDYSDSLQFLMNIMKYGGNKINKTYCFYEIIKLLNNVQTNNSKKFTALFIETVVNKIKEFQPDINKINIPLYFKKKVFEEFEKFLENNKKILITL